MAHKGTSTTYRSILQRELSLRIARNPRYSLRAFARDLGLAAPKLSQVLHKSCGISRQSAQKIAQHLHLSEAETEYFVTLADLEHNRSRSGKELAKERLKIIETERFGELDLERFKIISDWHHFAILELADVKGFDSRRAWIARRLGITISEAGDAIERLLDHGLLARDPQGKLRQTTANLATPSGVPSREIRAHHSQILRKADEALDRVPVEERDFSTNTLAIDPAKLGEARQALREFRRKFCNDLQASPDKKRVYCLAIQFFPLDEPSSPSRSA